MSAAVIKSLFKGDFINTKNVSAVQYSKVQYSKAVQDQKKLGHLDFVTPKFENMCSIIVMTLLPRMPCFDTICLWNVEGIVEL